MSVDYEGFWAAAEQLGNRSGVPTEFGALQVMALFTMAMGSDLPPELWPGLVSGLRRWLPVTNGGAELLDTEGDSLEPYRVNAWTLLDQKEIAGEKLTGKAYIAVRALICILWDGPSDEYPIDDWICFFCGLVEGYGGLDWVLEVTDCSRDDEQVRH